MGLVQPFAGNAATAWGTAAEPLALGTYEAVTGQRIASCMFQGGLTRCGGAAAWGAVWCAAECGALAWLRLRARALLHRTGQSNRPTFPCLFCSEAR